MREILFRGKRIDNNEWIYGFYYEKPNPHTEDGRPILHCISDLPPFGADVLPETVGQYTGLKGKGNKKIFEGDIVRTKKYGKIIRGINVNNFDTFEIVYHPCTFRLENKRRGFNLVDNKHDQYEVIGNIYDNPELLKEVSQ